METNIETELFHIQEEVCSLQTNSLVLLKKNEHCNFFWKVVCNGEFSHKTALNICFLFGIICIIKCTFSVMK